jgi:hypothetical protein
MLHVVLSRYCLYMFSFLHTVGFVCRTDEELLTIVKVFTA